MVEHVGRNDPCPCGSGKKYKKCCEARLSEDRRSAASWIRPHAATGKSLFGRAMPVSVALSKEEDSQDKQIPSEANKVASLLHKKEGHPKETTHGGSLPSSEEDKSSSNDGPIST